MILENSEIYKEGFNTLSQQGLVARDSVRKSESLPSAHDDATTEPFKD